MQHGVELKDPLWAKRILYPDPSQTAHNLRKQYLIMEMFNWLGARKISLFILLQESLSLSRQHNQHSVHNLY